MRRASHLFCDNAILVDVHRLEELLQRRLLTHELNKGELSVKVSVHVCKELFNFSPVENKFNDGETSPIIDERV